MSDNAPTLPFAEVPDDYFAECEEHLAAARRGVLALRTWVDQPLADDEIVDDLFRAFHSIKGLSAMVGVRPAEQLAHALEDFLGTLRRGAVVLATEGCDVLVEGVKALDEVITARREHSPKPDVSRLVARLASLVASRREAQRDATADSEAPRQQSSGAAADLKATSELSGPRLTPRERARLNVALTAGARPHCFRFSPTPALAERGINVNTARARLTEAGEIVHAEPRIGSSGEVTFLFLVATRADEGAIAAWSAEGLTPVAWEDETGQVAGTTGGTSGPARARTNLVRVDLAKLDELMRLVGELVITRGRFEQGLKRAGAAARGAAWRPFHETNQALERQLRDLREAVMSVRLVPMREAFEKMDFVVHDLTRGTGKLVNLHTTGEQTEVDKLIVDRLMDPLLHLVRNAVSHGLETPAERVAAGKPATGRLSLRAAAEGEMAVIEVEDDGRGVDRAAVYARAREADIVADAGVLGCGADADAARLLDLICRPSFSTREEADRSSGRGVGMAVVSTAVESMGGTLELATRPGHGAKFTMRLPLTLAITDALIVRAGGERYAVPRGQVREVLRGETGDVTTFDSNELLTNRGQPLALVRLDRLFSLPAADRQSFHVLVVGPAAGLVVDQVIDLREIVIRPLIDPLVRQPGLVGATELGDRQAILILDAKTLVEHYGRRPNDHRQTVI